MVRILGQALPRVAGLGRTVPFQLACRAVTVTWYTTAGHPGIPAGSSPHRRHGYQAPPCHHRRNT